MLTNPVPPAGLIEVARDETETLPDVQRQKQFLELHAAMGGDVLNYEFANGYELGLQTGRVMIRQNTAVILAKLKPEDIL